MRKILGTLLCVGILSCGGQIPDQSGNSNSPSGDIATVQSAIVFPNNHDFPNDEGIARTFNPAGSTDTNSIFFQDFGTNGRTCGTCHKIESGWSVNAAGISASFDATGGTDPIFRTNDGSNSPRAPVGTLAERRAAYSMLTSKGLIRVGRPIPPGAEFVLDQVDDPYGFASAAELSLFRRPLPSMNLKFITSVMWDGRETVVASDIPFDLRHQANDATLGHAQAARELTEAQKAGIERFEIPLFTAQYVGKDAGRLNAAGARGGPRFLSTVPFSVGITNPGSTFDLFDNWENLTGTDSVSVTRRAVQRGQKLFNTKTFRISGASGIVDQVGTCSTCHNTPNVGGHSSPFFADIGISDGSRRTADMPLYKLKNTTTHEIRFTTDPGLALSTGKWADIGRFKVPNLRAIETRSPYFHSGFKDTIEGVVEFYNDRFHIGLTAAEQADLTEFIKVL